jgi:hypothetical protein
LSFNVSSANSAVVVAAVSATMRGSSEAAVNGCDESGFSKLVLGTPTPKANMGAEVSRLSSTPVTSACLIGPVSRSTRATASVVASVSLLVPAKT